jgi:SAM-dependent methyltransferase
MAALNPKADFTGLEKSKRKVNKAKEKYKLPNLDFKVGDASSEIFEKESLDAIVNSYVLHEVYSGSRYNEQIVSDTLRKQFKMLKKGGIMFIRDYASPPPEEFVLLEMPDTKSTGKELSELSECDLLIWYAEHARPRQDAGCGGFFLEELPERYPKTRLFRLPYKWAYEFIMRKDDRKHWETELPIEYTFFTEDDFRKELRTLGARVQYSAPHWDEDMIAERFDGHFRLYANNGASMGHPPTCFVAVSYKMAERKSLRIEERRPSFSEKSSLKITAMRNKQTGEITDVVSRDLHVSEVIPYRIDSRGYLKVYLHDGVARSIANAVPRGGVNFDGRRWSGHMVEPISVDGEAISKMEAFDIKHTALFARDYLGLKPAPDAILEHGPDYYPAPDYIDEKIHTYYLNARKAKGAITPKDHAGMSEKFQAKGFIREIDAQQVLDAITVGMIPNARLELQILALFQHFKMKAETWTDKKLNLQINKLATPSDMSALLKSMSEPDERFKAVKGTAGQLRSIHSTFVEEGQSSGALSGLSAESVDFIVHDGETINTAVILPLTKDLKGDIHAGFNVKYMPVPQRHEGNGLTATAPTLNIPPEVVNNKQLKKFIADEYGIAVTSVFKMGESYFSHLGVTPRRIHPFAIAAPPEMMKDPDSHFIPFYQMMLLQRMLAKEPHFMTVLARSYRYFHEELQLEAKHDVKAILKKRFESLQPDWSLPIHYENMDLEREHLDEQIEQHDHAREEEMERKHKHDEEKRLRHQLEEEEHKKAAQRAAQSGVKQAKIDAEKAELLEKYKPKEDSQLTSSFESELEEFMDQFKDDLQHKPVPEKW